MYLLLCLFQLSICTALTVERLTVSEEISSRTGERAHRGRGPRHSHGSSLISQLVHGYVLPATLETSRENFPLCAAPLAATHCTALSANPKVSSGGQGKRPTVTHSCAFDNPRN